MNPRARFFLKLAGGLLMLLVLCLLFPPLAAWAEAAGRELRYLWFLVLIVVLAAWLIWGLGAKKK
ncbi:MAG TPA: hypothetical protein VF607_13020 [Verrucomicrobiae bacterium]